MNDASGLHGQRVLVTGGTRGIGRAIALQCARAGARVIANYARNDEAAQALAAEASAAGLALEVLRADLTLPKGQAAVQERLAADPADAGPLSIVHCAATGVHRPFDELTAKHLDWTLALNVRAFFELLRTLLPTKVIEIRATTPINPTMIAYCCPAAPRCCCLPMESTSRIRMLTMVIHFLLMVKRNVYG